MSLSEAKYHYRAYGLTWQSEIDLGWPAAPGSSEPDVVVRFGEIPEQLEAPADIFGPIQTAPGQYLLRVDGVGGLLVSEGGSSVVVSAADGAVNDVAAYMTGSAVAACLKIRGVLTLHASAVATSAGAVCFAGPPGAGKSTLLAGLVERGYAMLADDVSGIVINEEGRPVMLSAHPQARLWPDSLGSLPEAWGRAAKASLRPGLDKSVVTVRRFRDRSLTLHAVFALHPHPGGNKLEQRLEAADAFATLVLNTYRVRPLRGLGLVIKHFQAVSGIVRHAAVHSLARPEAPGSSADFAERVAEILPPP